jgi:hypothetical protein
MARSEASLLARSCVVAYAVSVVVIPCPAVVPSAGEENNRWSEVPSEPVGYRLVDPHGGARSAGNMLASG